MTSNCPLGLPSPLAMRAAAFIAEWEGFRDTAYTDGVGIWTIGYGHTRGVKEGDTITEEDAGQLLLGEVSDLKRHLEILEVPCWDLMADKQKVALLSFAFNLGRAPFDRARFTYYESFQSALGYRQNPISPTEVTFDELRERGVAPSAWYRMPAAMALYVSAWRPAVRDGLLRRRLAEGSLWAEGLLELAEKAR